MIPDNVEKIVMTKQDYDRNVEQLLFDKIKAEQELERYKNIVDELKKENEKLHKQVVEYQDEIFARDNNWYDMCD